MVSVTSTSILLVDDEDELLEVMQEYIEYCGFKDVNIAHSGAEALEKLSEKEIDIVFCDLKMPHMNCLEVYSALKKSKQLRDFVLLTGSDIEDIKTSSKYIDEIEIIKKPFDFKNIIERISKAAAKPLIR